MSNNIKHSPSPSEGDINFSETVSILREYKFSILAFVFSFTLFTGMIAYFTPNTYQANSSIEILSDKVSNKTGYMSSALEIDANNVENEIAILSSHSIATLALENLNLGTRYFSSKNFKTQELYKNSPFIVTTESIDYNLRGEKFEIIPIDQDNFHLSVKASLLERSLYLLQSKLGDVPEGKAPANYYSTHKFNSPIYTPWFTITVKKIHTLSNNNYIFTIQDNQDAINIGKNLTITSSTRDGSIIQLSYEDTVPQRAQEILETIINSYIDQSLQIKKKSAEQSLSFLDSQLMAMHSTLNRSATSLRKYKTVNTIIDVNSKALLAAEKLSELETKVYDLDIQINVIEGLLNFIQTHQNIEGINIGSVGGSASPAIVSLVEKIQEANTLEKSLLVDYTEFHPDVIKTREESKSLRNTLTEALKHSLNNRKKQKQSLGKIITREKTSFKSLPKQEQELSQLSRSFMANEKIYAFLLEKRAEAAILQSSTISGTRVIDLSVLQKDPIKPKRPIMIIAGLLLGFIVGVIFAFIHVKLHDLIKSVTDITNSTDIPIFGMIPKLNLRRKDQSFYEAIRVVRTNIDFSQNHTKSKIITVTSSISGEGKTTLITELAKIIVLAEKKVLLVDLDMRKPKVHERFNIKNDIGMSTILSGQSTLDDSIQTSVGTANLHIIPSGPIPPNPSELLLSDSFKMALEELSSKYDYVLFDSPPIGHVTDASSLMHASDISLIVLRLDYSKKDFIKNINRLKDEQQFGNIGLIINGIQEENFTYGYGSAY